MVCISHLTDGQLHVHTVVYVFHHFQVCLSYSLGFCSSLSQDMEEQYMIVVWFSLPVFSHEINRRKKERKKKRHFISLCVCVCACVYIYIYIYIYIYTLCVCVCLRERERENCVCFVKVVIRTSHIICRCFWFTLLPRRNLKWSKQHFLNSVHLHSMWQLHYWVSFV